MRSRRALLFATLFLFVISALAWFHKPLMVRGFYALLGSALGVDLGIFLFSLAQMCFGLALYREWVFGGRSPEERPALLRFGAGLLGKGWLYGIVGVVFIGNVLQYTVVFDTFEEHLEPAALKGDRVVSTIAPYAFRPPRRGDLVWVQRGHKYAMIACRVVGLPGETVRMRSGVLSVDGRDLRESYRTGQTGRWDLPQLGPEEYLVLGDRSVDGKWRGRVVERREIVAQFVLRIWPLGRFGILPDPEISFRSHDAPFARLGTP